VAPAAASEREPAPDGGEARAGGLLVLAIDDDANVRDLLREDLADAGYRVVGAADGEEGRRLARELKPFAITLDILMPGSDGWQVLHELKGDPATRDIPVIMLTIVDQKKQGFRLGATDYLVKPIDRDAVLAALARLPTGRGRVLVVDDDPDVPDMVRQLLEGEGYEVDAAGGGEEALAAIAARRPDVVLLDLLMPGLDGLGVIERLEADPALRDIPIVVLTAKVLTAGEESWLRERVVSVIEKQGLARTALVRELRLALDGYRRGEGTRQ
jgi:CheY-like chemotaxis protein